MSLDDPSWFAAELGLPTLEEAEDELLANKMARQTMATELPGSLDAAAAALIGSAPDHTGLAELISAARDGRRASALLRGDRAWRVLATPLSGGRAKLTFAPAHLEQELDVRRRAALVDVAASVSHEVANALSAIGGWAELGRRTQATGGDPAEALRLIESCSNTAQQAARRLLRLARGEETVEVGGTDAGELAREVSALLSLDARQIGAELSTEAPLGQFVRASRAELFSVLWNLTKNAIEACERGDTINVTVDSGPGNDVQIRVQDTGPGLDEEAQKRVFTPYFTTKQEGTGLGLPLVHKTVQQLGGDLTLQSSPGQGASFTARLPREVRDTFPQVAATDDRTVSQSETAPRSRAVLDARVLVVDDDDALRGMVTTVLQLKGAQVVAAASRDEALQAEGPFDVALIDMVLREDRGDELLAELRQRGIVQAAILVTGVVQKPKPVPGGEPDDWVRKPFEVAQLVERLRRTLERHQMLSAAVIGNSG